MIHTHNDNSVNFLSPGSGGMEGGEDFGGSLSCQGNVGEGGGVSRPQRYLSRVVHNSQS